MFVKQKMRLVSGILTITEPEDFWRPSRDQRVVCKPWCFPHNHRNLLTRHVLRLNQGSESVPRETRIDGQIWRHSIKPKKQVEHWDTWLGLGRKKTSGKSKQIRRRRSFETGRTGRPNHPNDVLRKLHFVWVKCTSSLHHGECNGHKVQRHDDKTFNNFILLTRLVPTLRLCLRKQLAPVMLVTSKRSTMTFAKCLTSQLIMSVQWPLMSGLTWHNCLPSAPYGNVCHSSPVRTSAFNLPFQRNYQNCCNNSKHSQTITHPVPHEASPAAVRSIASHPSCSLRSRVTIIFTCIRFMLQAGQ